MRTLCVPALVLAVAAAPAAVASGRVVGGTPADVRSAPWNVVIVHGTFQSQALCTGSIIDALHVLTAGHCVLESGGAVASPHTFLVRAGVTNAVTPSASDRVQDRAVASIRVHPAYLDDPRAEADDVAVLTLASSLDLSGPTAQPIALPGPELRPRPGQAVALAGFGVTTAAGSSDVTLNRMTSTLIDDFKCLRPPDDTHGAVLLCAFSGANSPCHGDSGSALVVTTPTPVAVGVTGSGTCNANTTAEFADLTAPEILQFVQGNDTPPMAPRATTSAALVLTTARPQVGQTVRCAPGLWSGDPAFLYSFREATNRLPLRGGPSGYTLRIGDSGSKLLCRVAATNAGGTTTVESPASAEVLPPPDLSVAAASARPGGTAVLRVSLVDWAQPVGMLTVCATSSPRLGSRACRTLRVAAAARPSVALRFPVKRTAAAGSARLGITAKAADGRSAAAPAVVRVR